ncbi:copper resistance CopC family protein [Methylosinus sp. Ce-a6]|uniref:copper resistance CopC family protein n=1 Tax=Methylosinus sp. Ce-a6 TaxID=2172005 RepID=UPI001FCEB779|nr:copper resistance CopC family protein [Methylosinus sp. Ce-a6]
MLLACLCAGVAGGARAHAILEHADPRVGSTISGAPSAVSLYFTQEVESSFTSIEVLNSAGARVDSGKPRVSGTTAQVGVEPLPPGHYTVRWRALSVDSHTTQGSFGFDVQR